MKKKTRIHIVSLGCPKNLIDSEVMAAQFAGSGYKITPHEEEAEVILVNTCAFILPAKEESIGEILRLAEWKKKGRCRNLIVTGCLPQRYGSALEKEIPEIDLFLGTGEVGRAVERIAALRAPIPPEEENGETGKRGGRKVYAPEPHYLMTAADSRVLSTPSFSAYLKIAEGCSNRCSYCIIPSIRGKLRSRRPEDIVEEAGQLAAKGVKELILIAQDTSAYGADLKGRPGLGALIKALANVRDIRWIRLLYAHPASLSEEVLEAMAGEEKACRYIDLPVQHIDDTILKAMNRKSGGAPIRRKIERARRIMPDLALRTSILVGFPGERESHFGRLLEFVRQTRFDHLGVFTYSREEGTAAARMTGTVPERVKQKRRDILMEEQALISYEINQGLIGSVQEVIVEGRSELAGYLLGRSRRQAPEIDGVTYIKKTKRLRPGEIVTCRITGADEYDLFAEEISS